MGYDRKQLKEAKKPMCGFRGRRFEPFSSISLLASFRSLQNART
jgi:hypothetical protein